jgi:multidrug resistance protein
LSIEAKLEPVKWAGGVLALLTALNFFNYIDRSVLFAVQPLVQAEFRRSDAQFGLLTTAFFWCYMLAAPLTGPLADRINRRSIMVVGAALWSAFTLLTAITHNFEGLLIRHTLVGIGEATFAAIAPAFLADMYPEHKRGRILSIFYLALPMGTAIGYLIGGALGTRYGWRAPFLVVAVPGLLLALALLWAPEPVRGSQDHIRPSLERSTLLGLVHNKAFWSATLGMAMMVFTVGGFQVWMPTFLSRVRHVPLKDANIIFGGMTLAAGLGATLVGGWLGDRYLKKHRGAYYIVSGAGMALALPMILIAVFYNGWAMYPAIFAGEFLLLLNTAPLNAAMINAVSANIRVTAIAVNLFIIHLLGDASSPYIMGWISDRTNLQMAFLAASVAVVLSAAILLNGARYAPEVAEEELRAA